MDLAASLDVLMFCALILGILSGAPVAFVLAGIALIFAALGIYFGVAEPRFLLELPLRIFGTMTNPALTAVPLFILMGAILERSRIAEDLLTTMGDLFGRMRGGLLFATTLVGALLAASTGVVGATVVTMGLLSLPVMLKRGYDPALATGSIAAAGTLGQIIPPSVVLILLGDALGNANNAAREIAPDLEARSVSVGDLFAGALIPGLVLVAIYLAYQALMVGLKPSLAPPGPDKAPSPARIAQALAAPLGLIVAVLGSIMAGAATPTEGAAVGAAGALLLAGLRQSEARGLARGVILIAFVSVLALLLLRGFVDLRLGRAEATALEQGAQLAAAGLIAVAFIGVVAAAFVLWRRTALQPAVRTTVEITAMVFTILIGATLFSAVFQELDGKHWVESMLTGIPGGLIGALIIVNLAIFILGFFIDFIEICFIVVPLTAPILIAMGADPVWLGVLFAVNLQTSFLTPPFGFALFYLRGVAPPEVKTMDIYRGALSFVGLQLIGLLLVAFFPALATWLPAQLYR